MADSVVLTCAHVLVGGYDLSAQYNELNVAVGAEMLDASTFGSQYRKHKGGVQTATITGKGITNLEASQVDDVLYGTIGYDGEVVTAFFDGITVGSTVGAYSMDSLSVKYVAGGSFGTLLGFDFEAQSRSKLVQIVPLDNALATNWTTGANNSAVVVFCTSGDKTLYGGIHVTALSTSLCTISGVIAANSSSGFTAFNPTGTTRISFNTQSCKDGTFAVPVSGGSLSTDQPFYRSVVTVSTGASGGGTARGLVFMGIE